MTKDDDVITLSEEHVVVQKRDVLDARIRVATKTGAVTEIIRETLDTETVEVTRVPIGCDVETAPQVRTEGNVTIIPVLEERLVVEKRLVLVEEVHIRRLTTSQSVNVPILLQKQTAFVERNEENRTGE